MNLKIARKEQSFKPNPELYSKALTFFPLSVQDSEDICQNINKNLFQLEKNLAYFHFAIQEIKEIT